jgi:3-O-methylgallate 3,4-dioxygenase
VFRARHEANQKGIAWVGRKLEEVAPDVVVMLGDDQSETFSREAIPAIAIVWQDEVPFKRRGSSQDQAMAWARELYGTEQMTFPVDAGLGKRIIESVSSEDFDVMHVRRLAENQTMSHAFGFVWRRLMPNRVIPTVPIHINTYFPPNQPTPARCLEFGRAVARAIESWDATARVAVFGSGGFSHFVDDEEIDHRAMKALKDKDEEAIAALPLERLQSGTSAIRNWIATAGAVEHQEMDVHDYVPRYRSAAGTGCGMAFPAWQ